MAELITRKKVSGSSLVEVLVALVIIMALFSLAIAIFLKVSTSGSSLMEKQARLQIKKMIREAEEKNDQETLVVQLDSITYHEDITNYGSYNDLRLIHVTAARNGKILAESRRVIKKGKTDD